MNLPADHEPWASNPNRNCATGDPENWFPTDAVAEKWANKLCAGCPVTNECLNWALTDRTEHGYPGGILGGTTETQRATLRNDTTPPTRIRETCGTMTGHTAHRRNKERICDDCRGAENTYRREWKKKRAVA